jgi:hypothetical protein
VRGPRDATHLYTRLGLVTEQPYQFADSAVRDKTRENRDGLLCPTDIGREGGIEVVFRVARIAYG